MAALGLGPCGFELLFDLLDISSGVLQCMRRLNPARNLRLAIGTETQIADCRRAGSLRSCDSDHRRQVAALVAREEHLADIRAGRTAKSLPMPFSPYRQSQVRNGHTTHFRVSATLTPESENSTDSQKARNTSCKTTGQRRLRRKHPNRKVPDMRQTWRNWDNVIRQQECIAFVL